MLAFEWRELEVLCDKISGLRYRYVAAQRSKNVGLLEGLKEDIAKAKRQREQLVHHISARLSSVAVERDSPATAAAQRHAAAKHGLPLKTGREGGNSTLVGFQDD